MIQPRFSTADPIPSSSPAFGTPAHPIPPRRTAPIPFHPPGLPTSNAPKPILQIALPPGTLRLHAVRTITKKHGLNLNSTALSRLASFIGQNCGVGWLKEGLAEPVLEEVAKGWKKANAGVIIEDGDILAGILKNIEGGMSGGKLGASSRQNSFVTAPGEHNSFGRATLEKEPSFGMSGLQVEGELDEEEDKLKDPREWMKVISAFEQPRLSYNSNKKHFEKVTAKPTLLPPPSHKTALFRHRYALTHQRILRNPSFSPSAFALTPNTAHTPHKSNKITPIANLLGRHSTTHLLLGLLTISPTGTLEIADLTGSISLDLQFAVSIPPESTYFTPGMIVLVEGVYEEDYSTGDGNLGNTNGIGGTIGGKFIASSLGHPPCERRSTTLGLPDPLKTENGSSLGPAFGWTDFLGLGSERAVGSKMRSLKSRIYTPGSPHFGNKHIAIASSVHLDQPSVLSAIRSLLRHYSILPREDYPLAIVLMGNFSSVAALAGAEGTGSIEYKENFDSLASILSEFSHLIAHTTLVFVPGDGDAWPSAFSAGAATPIPRKGVPDFFTRRVERAVEGANREHRGTGKVEWTSNPSRIAWFGGTGEMVLFRDDLGGRCRRLGVRLKSEEQTPDSAGDKRARAAREGSVVADMQRAESDSSNNGDAVAGADAMDVDENDDNAPATRQGQLQQRPQVDPTTLTARRITRTLLDQAHLSPFPLASRPVHWDFAGALNMYPLPSALVLADPEMDAWVVGYMGCVVMNPGAIAVGGTEGGRRGRKQKGARWVEFDVVGGKGRVVGTEG
ncbi:hypothetical protein K402DRAFT_356611 [Aulographum hederae CBS 113979]|uniref:DNA polymerase epsilon subunit B n=1 Tax=Aulographum hederae CBS 113979 TaxID=1176131 RepID=A0A6G1GY45_9PEZI|nr:hypothetical protein K402DRAFT_356611 [Aulographum hederae CBS 113979]